MVRADGDVWVSVSIDVPLPPGSRLGSGVAARAGEIEYNDTRSENTVIRAELREVPLLLGGSSIPSS
jgi:hypothetical protein